MYLAEYKTMFHSLIDMNQNFIKLNFLSTAKPNSIYTSNYESKKYNTQASKINTNLNHYFQIENANQNKNIIFSYRELLNLVTFFNNTDFNKQTDKFEYLPVNNSIYPAIMFFKDVNTNSFQIWIYSQTETYLLLVCDPYELYLIVELSKQTLSSFVLNCSLNTNTYMSASTGSETTVTNTQPRPPFNTEVQKAPFSEPSTYQEKPKQESASLNENTEETNPMNLDLNQDEDPEDLPDWMK